MDTQQDNTATPIDEIPIETQPETEVAATEPEDAAYTFIEGAAKQSELEAELAASRRMMEDLQKIQHLAPQVQSLSELGDDFAALMACDRVDAVTAYLATAGRRTRTLPLQGSKSHIIKTGGAVGVPTGKDIPKNDLTEWQDMFPDADTKKLREIYNNALTTYGNSGY